MTRRTTTAPATAVPALLAVILLLGTTAGCTVHIGDGQREATGDEITEVRDVTAVTRVELRTTGTLNLAVGDDVALSVTGKEDILDDLVTKVEGDTLVIDLPGSWRDPGFLEYDLVLPGLSTVVLAGSGEVYGTLGADDAVEVRIDGSGTVAMDELAADQVTLGIHGSGSIAAHQITSGAVDVLVDGSGDVDAEGTADHLSVSIPGSGEVHLDGLAAGTGEVAIDGSGEATVNVSGALRAAISGSGDITYLGDPDVDEDIDGSGEVHRG